MPSTTATLPDRAGETPPEGLGSWSASGCWCRLRTRSISAGAAPDSVAWDTFRSLRGRRSWLELRSSSHGATSRLRGQLTGRLRNWPVASTQIWADWRRDRRARSHREDDGGQLGPASAAVRPVSDPAPSLRTLRRGTAFTVEAVDLLGDRACGRSGSPAPVPIVPSDGDLTPIPRQISADGLGRSGCGGRRS